nr:hypothetical protein [Variovorax paradoxus]
MTSRQIGALEALVFVLATLGATALLVAAGLSEEPQPTSASDCPACLPATAR